MREKFDEEYILELFKVCLNEGKYLDAIIPHLKYTYLPTEQHKELWRAIITEFKLSKVKKAPSIGVLKMHFRKNLKVLELLNDIREVDVNEDSVVGVFEEFIKQNKFVEAYEEIYKTYNRGNRTSAYKIFTDKAKEFENFSIRNAKFERVFNDFTSRVTQREVDKLEGVKEKLPFPIDELNYHTNGGGEIGEAVLFLGQSGSGKSFLLTQCGIHIARRGEKVVHFQAEGTRRQCMDRYDSCWTGAVYYEIKDNSVSAKKLDRCYKVVENIGRGEVYVECFEKFGSKSMADVRQAVIELKKEHPDLKCVIIDYMDLLHPGDGHTYGKDIAGEKARQQAVGRAIKDLAVEQKVLVITATQASSVDPTDLQDPNFVMSRFNLGADKDKTQPFDLFVTINRTRDEKKSKICRLHIDKAREHAGEVTMYIYQSLARSRFYDRKKTLEEFFTDEYIDSLQDAA